jgi:hypothetical protein
MNCDGTVTNSDALDYFMPQFTTPGSPGPSGLRCAGDTTPCPAACTGPLCDDDGDGRINRADNCTAIPNPTQCDTDGDDYGNQCDGDFDQNGAVNPTDFGQYFVPDRNAGVDGGTGTDMNCDGAVDQVDLDDFFTPQFTTPGSPGPSGYH